MVFPERLREGDTVGLVSPAFPVKEEERDGCVKLAVSCNGRLFIS